MPRASVDRPVRRSALRSWAEWIGLFAAAVALAGGLLAARLVDPIDALIHDAILRATPHAPDPRILIVAIDDASLRALGRWPWPRERHAALIDRLAAAGPAAIGYDVLFVDPASGDAALAASLARARRVALPLLIASPGDDGAPYRLTPPVVAGAAQGHVVVHADADGVVRRVVLGERAGDGTVDHLAVQILRLAHLGAAHTGTLIPFVGPPGSYPSLSFSAVARGDVPPELLRGRVVLVGATAAGLGDRFAVPTGGEHDLMPGVEVQANIADALLHGRLRAIAPRWASLLLAALALLALWAGFLLLGPRANVIAALAILAATLSVSSGLLLAAHLWLRPAAALVVIVVMFPFWGWRRLAAASRFLDAEIVRLAHEGCDTAPARGRGDRLHRQIALLDAATDRLHRLQRQRDDSLAFLSHDLRSPAAAILGLVPGNSPNPTDRRVVRHATRMLRLADQFVQSARAEEAPLACELVDLADALIEGCDQCWEAARRIGTHVEVVAEPDRITVAIDRALFARALVNLIDNALKYGRAGTTIFVRGWLQGQFAVVTVADHGLGMDSAQVAALFGRYERVGATRPDGAGLGLALVATFARRHGGRVECISRQGLGSIFRIELPLAR